MLLAPRASVLVLVRTSDAQREARGSTRGPRYIACGGLCCPNARGSVSLRASREVLSLSRVPPNSVAAHSPAPHGLPHLAHTAYTGRELWPRRSLTPLAVPAPRRIHCCSRHCGSSAESAQTLVARPQRRPSRHASRSSPVPWLSSTQRMPGVWLRCARRYQSRTRARQRVSLQ